MACSCGSGRRGGAPVLGTEGQRGVYRLFHPGGATVDYSTPERADQAKAAVGGSYWEFVDYRTGLKIT